MKLLAAAISLIVNGKWLIVSLLTILFTIHYSLFTKPSPALAQEPPAPLPCQNPIRDDSVLTSNWLVNENKEPPGGLHKVPVVAYGRSGQNVSVVHYFDFPVDFSQLGALFGKSNSDYLEGKFQSDEHRNTAIDSLNQQDINSFHGPGQKAAPRAMLDELRVNYVKYVWENEHLVESANVYTDVNGQGSPKTIYDLRSDFGEPDPNTQRNADAWQSGWGKYWDKIPTAYSEFYEGEIVFREESRDNRIATVLAGGYCPDPLPRAPIKIVLPEFFRTTATSGQLNQIIVPKAAQSDHSNDFIGQNNAVPTQNKNLLGKIIDACLKAVKSNPLTNALQEVVKVSKLLNPVKTASAAEPADCIRVLVDGKEGSDPYCALPAGQLQQGESCDDKIDEFKVDKDNPNVICYFRILWEKDMQINNTNPNDPNSFDECSQVDVDYWQCTVYVSIWPIFRIPLIAEIWNNTLYSDTKDNEPLIGSEDFQEEGQPGVYSFFTPRAIFEDELEAMQRNCTNRLPIESDESIPEICQEMLSYVEDQVRGTVFEEEFNNCIMTLLLNVNNLLNCVIGVSEHIEKKQPGENNIQTDSDLKRRFIGGADCSKEYVWHNALYPRAAQSEFGITNACPVDAAQLPDQGTSPGTGPPITDCAPASDGDDSNGIETSPDEIMCYIVEQAGDEIEPLSNEYLAIVMLDVVIGESGAGQCAFNTSAGALGVFQFITSTWRGVIDNPDIDSGSVHASPSGACWGNSGEEPDVVGDNNGDPAYEWSLQFGPNLDGEAWNPFLQVDKTIEMMRAGRAGEWCVYRDIYMDDPCLP